METQMITTRRTCLMLAGVASGSLLVKAAEPLADCDLLALFAKRQSVRRYKPDPVPEEHLRRILDAARRAPTSGNQQPWKFLVVRDRAKIDRMKARCIERSTVGINSLSATEREARRKAVEERMAGYFSAPVYIVVLTDSESEYPSYNHHDGPMAAGYLMLAARTLGYGTVYITDSIPDEITREVLAIPARYQRVCITPVGIPAGWPDPSPKKKLEDLVAYETL
jgi:nitroreductase